MELARLRLNSQVKVFFGFFGATVLLGLEAKGPVLSRVVFIGLPLLLATVSGSEMIARAVHFIIFFELMIMSAFWPVSVFSKALIFATLTWYLSEFPQRALANLVVALVVLAIAIVSAPVTQQF
ncbi:hypothetical protein HYZ64_00300 [Candidatus Berkelbacteria bacterium]|nr:hypothetical protein [Candidatus Berkelbacteria bacterium]